MAKPKLILYLDVVSPFAYLAFYVVRSSPVFKDCNVTYVPVFLGGIMKTTRNTPPIEIKNKGVWIGKERLRWARSFRIPMADEMPPGFPNNTIHVQRALTAVSLMHPERLEEMFAALYHASFALGQDIHTPASLEPVFVGMFGERQAKEILTRITSDEVKKVLIAKTDEALAEGSFGLPWYAATNDKGQTEHYWGFDHIAQVADHLGLERPKPGDASEGSWRSML